MAILRNIGKLVTCSGIDTQEAGHVLPDAAIIWEHDKITWVGREKSLPTGLKDHEEIDAERRLVIPGLVDCHTHLAFGGWRADEFARRSRGATYQEVARAGGGIRSTVRSTRAETEEALAGKSLQFLSEISRLGVTTIECKSGYGLSTAEELKLLRVYDGLRRKQPLRIVSTFLGAHVVPEEFEGNPDGYVDTVINEMIPAVAENMLASYCDVFVEEGAFDIERSRRILEAGKAAGLRPKLHADQLTDGGGAALAAEVGAASADHLEYTSVAGMDAMAEAGVVAVSLPIATLYLRQDPLDAREFIGRGVRVAVATDFNPGSAPSYHLPLAMTLACTLNRMTPGQALKGATLFAARAIGLADEIGSLEVGKQADLTMIDAADVDHWLYHFRPNSVAGSWVNGTKVLFPDLDQEALDA